MGEIRTSYPGPLGSLIHHFRADARTVASLAGMDWSRRFRRVWLDPVREVVVLTELSFRRESLILLLDDLVSVAADELRRDLERVGSVRWRGEGEPRDTGIEPDGSFYLEERSRGYFHARMEGEKAVSAFRERNAPDLVLEVEMTPADEGKIARYADLGVRELWRFRGERGKQAMRADFLALRRGEPPRPLPASEVLSDLTPEGVCGILESARRRRSGRERLETVARLVRRCERSDSPAPEEHAPPETPGEDDSAQAAAVPPTEDPETPETGVSTSYLGPLDSMIHHFRVDARTFAAFTGVDWNRQFSRVWLDPRRKAVVLMEQSYLHGKRTGVFEDLIDAAATALGRSSRSLRRTRWRREGDPPETGIEADGSFYVGNRAKRYRKAVAEGWAAEEAFAERTGPDLVFEVEMTHADDEKPAGYAALGVRELWRAHPAPEEEEEEEALRVDFLALRRDAAPRPLPASEVLPGLTPEEVGAAFPLVERCFDRDEPLEVLRHIVRRRRKTGPPPRERASRGETADDRGKSG